ncbi:MAG: hypothetical protein ACHQHP_03105 [Bacteroidia bacterium]
MKRVLFFALFISVSLLSFSQRRDTFNLLPNGQKAKKGDVVKELKSHPQSKLDSVYYIKYGKIAAKCPSEQLSRAGSSNCFHEATVDSTNIVTVSKATPADKDSKTETTPTTSAHWNMLISSIQVNSFFSIPEKVGNPGTGDENTEWLEINYAGKTHKVTFDSTGPDEYEGINNLLKLLKKFTAF